MDVSQISLNKEDILIVDDTPENLRVLSLLLTKQGFSVRKALSGQMALMAVETVQPDLILLDIMMPGMDGYEVCQRLKTNPKTAPIPVIFLSALHEGFDKVKAFTAGGSDYITKPFQFEEVLMRVQNQLFLRQAELRNQQLNLELEAKVKERTEQLEAINQELKREIKEREQLQDQLLEMAQQDALTKLPNRGLFMTQLEEALNHTKQNPTYQFAVLFLDCDRFKVVNDSLGHLVGDELLIAIAHAIQATLDPNHTLARLGGDEFAILLSAIESPRTATQVAEKILQILTHPFQIDRYEVFINASIGIAVGSADYNKPEHLLRDADTAMYRAKALGRAQFQIFDPTMHDDALKLLQLETDLRRAIQQQEFVVHYQPIVNLSTGRITGFESLIRWQHPQRGLVFPGTFISIAEESGLIAQISDWVLKQACHQMYLWQKQGLLSIPIRISVNLSAKQFVQPNLIEQIDMILTETGFDPQFLNLEITESAIMNNPHSAACVLQKLRERKIQLSIDDFGTGYSSLSYLHSFPVDTLKIDRSFIQRLDGTQENLGLVPLIVNIAQTMGISVVAEGIETPQQLTQLQALNCGFGQGFLFSKPLESEQALSLLNTAFTLVDSSHLAENT